MKYLKYLLSLLALVAGLFLNERSKRKSAEALNDNNEALKDVQKNAGKIEKNKGLIDAEEEKRKSIKKDKEDEKENTDGNADFFTKRK